MLQLFTGTKGEFSVKITAIIVEYQTVSAISVNSFSYNVLHLEVNFMKVKLIHFTRKYNLLFSLI